MVWPTWAPPASRQKDISVLARQLTLIQKNSKDCHFIMSKERVYLEFRRFTGASLGASLPRDNSEWATAATMA